MGSVATHATKDFVMKNHNRISVDEHIWLCLVTATLAAPQAQSAKPFPVLAVWLFVGRATIFN